MASIVSEAEAAIANRFEVLEPQIYNSNARQVPKSPEWFMSASAKIKVIAKNMTKAQWTKSIFNCSKKNFP